MNVRRWVVLSLLIAAVVLARELQSSGVASSDCLEENVPDSGGLAAPSGLNAEYDSFQPVAELMWNDNSENEACFVIEYRFLYPEYAVLEILPANTTHHTVHAPVTGGRVEYRVFAATGSARSVSSDPYSVYWAAFEPTPGPTNAPQLRGDLDCSGAVDASDSMRLLLHAGGLPPLGPHPQTCPSWIQPPVPYPADLNCDNAIDIADALLPIQYASGLRIDLPPDCPEIGEYP